MTNGEVELQAMPTRMVSEDTGNPEGMPEVQIAILEHEQKREKRLTPYKTLITKTCITCGLQFKMPKWYETKENRGLFCSKKCKEKYKRNERLVKRTCKGCGKEFEVLQCKINRGRGLYCSFECFKKRPTTKIERTCKRCGKSFEVIQYTIKRRRTGEYCSVECASYRNHLWKGGISYERYCPKFNHGMKTRIREFFNNECVICGKTEQDNGQRMACHHVEYNKNICCDDNKPYFAAVCADHHRRTNGERERWAEMLRRVIDEIYGGKSYYTKEEWKEIKKNRRITECEKNLKIGT